MNLRSSKSPRSILGVLLVAGLLVSGCDKQAPEAGKEAAKTKATATEAAEPRAAEPVAPAVAEPAADPSERPAGDAAPSTDYNGSYANTNGLELKIENFVAEKGFDFAVSSAGSDDCGGIEYKGAAKFSEANTAKSEQDDLFKLDHGAVSFEPSIEMVGMDCARVVDTDFKKK